MAIYRFSMQVISRSEGRSAVIAAAYRAGAALRDQRLGRSVSYEQKPGVVHTEILAPAGAPDWVFDRERLWNTVEKVERREDAQIAREVQIALPIELTHEQQLDLIRDFVQEQFVAKGMIADLCVHREADDNPHAHIMLSMRTIGGDGFGNKERAWNAKNELFRWRKAWEHHANRALARAGRPERIDCRSHQDIGADLRPQPKLKRSMREVEQDRRAVAISRAEDLRRAARDNGERLCAKPEMALDLLLSRQSTFSERDLQRFAHRHSDDPEQFERVLSAIKACPELVCLRQQDSQVRYTSREVVTRERAMLLDAARLVESKAHRVRQPLIEQALANEPKLNPEQAAAVRALCDGQDLGIVEGYAGAGKSTMLNVAREAWEAAGYQVVGAALAGKAAEGLTESAGMPARTLAGWEWRWAQGKDHLTHRHVLVIDEAGMVGTREMASVIARAREAGAKVVLVGDTLQLQAIEAGAPMRILRDRIGSSRLTTVVRQKVAWMAEASKAFGDGRASDALRAYLERGRVHGFDTTSDAQAALIAAWHKGRLDYPGESTLLLAFRKKDVRELNLQARAVFRAEGRLGDDHAFVTAQGTRHFAEGDRLYFLRNDNALGVKNGTLGTIERIEGGKLQVLVDGDAQRRIVVDATEYVHLDHGYASTAHKGQGATVDRAYVLATRHFDASATYVALSRQRQDAQLFYGRDELASEQHLVRALTRKVEDVMAHDLLELTREEAVAIAERHKDARFLAMSPEQQARRLDRLKALGRRGELSAAQVLASMPEVAAATSRREHAHTALREARAKHEAFVRAHPVQAQLRASAFRAVEADVARARQTLAEADKVLERLRTDPARRNAAEQAARDHNRRVQRHRTESQRLSALRRHHERQALLARHAFIASTAQQKVLFTVLSAEHEGQELTVLGKTDIAGRTALVLAASNGSRVIVDRDSMGAQLSDLARGTRVRALAGGRIAPITHEHAPDRER